MKRLMKQLVQISYQNGVLHAETVEKIAGKLTRNELKVYIRGLKDQEKRSTVYVEAPITLSAEEEKNIESLFGKKVVSRKNPELLLGLKITDEDDVYNMNLKTNLERIETYAGQ